MWHEEIKLRTGDHRVLTKRMLIGQIVAHDRLQRDLVALFRTTFVSLLERFGYQRRVGCSA